MVTGKRRGRLGAHILAGKNQLSSDVAVALGGADDGMDPHRLLEASLASCTIITLQMYATRKQIDLKDIDVIVTIEKEGPETQILRQIKLVGEIDEAQRRRLMEIADKCPIHKLLSSHISIKSI